jgi:hypothetical protein
LYKSVHKILGEGNFVLVVAEATFGGVPTGIYDLFRIEKGRIAEHLGYARSDSASRSMEK